MADASKVRTHPQREALEAELISGANVMELSRKYSVSPDSLYRRKRTLTAQQLSEQEIQRSISRLGVSQRLAQVAAAARRAGVEAEEARNGRQKLAALDLERRTLNDLLNVIPELDHAAQDADFSALLTAVSGVLKDRKDPELAADVAARLRAAEASETLTGAVQDLATRLEEKKK
jgi:hypothetical protein